MTTAVQSEVVPAVELLTPAELASALKTTVRMVRRLVAERRIEYVKVGRSVRFEPSAVAAYVEANRVRPDHRRTVRRLR
jgi:excisionase family DNA binding protein